MGIPVDQLISTMYYNTTRKQAKKLVEEGLVDEDNDT